MLQRFLNPQIGVVVPVYEREEELRRCLHALIAQDFNSYQIIVVDDCSLRINVKKICKSISNDIVYLRTNKNVGPGMARELGLTYIKENNIPYVCFIDADDVPLPYMLSNLFITIDGKPLQIVDSPLLVQKFETDFIATDSYHPRENITWLMGKIYRTSFLEQYDIHFHPELRDHEDLYFNMIAYALCPWEEYYTLEKHLYYLTNSTNSLTHTLPYYQTYSSYVESSCYGVLWLIKNNYLECLYQITNNIFIAYDYYEQLKYNKSYNFAKLDGLLTEVISNKEFQKCLLRIDNWYESKDYLHQYSLIDSSLLKFQSQLKLDRVFLYQETLYEWLVKHGFNNLTEIIELKNENNSN